MSNEKALAKAAIQKAINNMKSMVGMIDNSSTTTSGGKTKTLVSVAPTKKKDYFSPNKKKDYFSPNKKKDEYFISTKFDPSMSGSVSMDMKTGESVYKPRKTRIF